MKGGRIVVDNLMLCQISQEVLNYYVNVNFNSGELMNERLYKIIESSFPFNLKDPNQII